MFTNNKIKFLGAVLSTALALNIASASAGAVRSNLGFETNSLLGNDDGSTGLVGLGFSIDFYGSSQTDAYVNNNGNITFDSPLGTYTPFALNTTSRQILAPFFADVDTRNGALTKYGNDTVGGNTAFGVNWVDVCFYQQNCSKTNSFQLVLIDRSDISLGSFDFEFNIDRIEWETGDASNGTNGLGGDSARVGWSNGATNTFELAGSGVNGAFLDSGPLGTSLIMNELNSALSVDGLTDGRYFFQVRNGVIVTDTPEPAPFALLGLGLLGLMVARRRRA